MQGDELTQSHSVAPIGASLTLPHDLLAQSRAKVELPTDALDSALPNIALESAKSYGVEAQIRAWKDK